MVNLLTDRRIGSFDICKGLCMLMVILGHQCEKTNLSTPLQFIQTFHMPLFFLIAGFFISDMVDLKEFSKKRIKRLLLPYVISCLIAAVLCAARVFIADSSVSSTLKELVKRLWISIYGSGSGYGSMIGSFGTKSEVGMMWYLLALLWSSIIVKAISKKRLSGLIAVMISSIAIGTTSIFGWIPFSIQNGLAAVMWVWLGYYVKKRGLLSEIHIFIRSPWILLILAAWLLSAIYGSTHLYGNFYLLGIVDVVGAVSGSLIVFGICLFLDNKAVWIGKVLSWIGVNSLLIYCLHFLENNVFPLSSVLKKIGVTEPTCIALISWVLVALITCVGAYILGKIKIVRKIYC